MRDASYDVPGDLSLVERFPKMRTLVIAGIIAFARVEDQNIPHAHRKQLSAAGGQVRGGTQLLPICHASVSRAFSLFFGFESRGAEDGQFSFRPFSKFGSQFHKFAGLTQTAVGGWNSIGGVRE